ncbi:MAG TPA: hypothetical protein VH253_03435 [Phycisphaerae bacterium]|nr:hypothetical protein [Phycisphaerae bacterium]
MRRCTPPSFFLFTCILTSSFAPSLFAADPAPPSPWLQPENAAKYVFVGKQVWNVDSGQVVSPTGAPALQTPARPILGVTDRYYLDMNSHYPGLPGMVTPGRVFAYDGTNVVPTLDGQRPQDYGHLGYWMNADSRRIVWIEKGDYWRGEADWTKGTIVNRKKITSLNAFDTHNTPLLWWAQYLFVYGGFDKDKPIVRINLATGDTDELPSAHGLNLGPDRALGGFVSPSYYRIVDPTSAILYCYDARTGQTTEIPSPLKAGPGSPPPAPLRTARARVDRR